MSSFAGWALVDGHRFEISDLYPKDGKLTFVLVRRACTLSIGPKCDFLLYGEDGVPFADVQQLEISNAPVCVVGGDLTLYLPIQWTETRAVNAPKKEIIVARDGAKVYPFTDALIGHRAYTYQLADKGLIAGEFGWVTDLDYFDDRYDELKLIRKKWVLVEEEPITLPSPYDIYEDDDVDE